MDNRLLFIWVLGLAAVIDAAELGLEGLKPAELKEIEKEIAAGNVPPNYVAEKPKRLVPKLSNADSPTFNHLGVGNIKPSYTITSGSLAGPQVGYNQQTSQYVPQNPTYIPQNPAYAPHNPAFAAGLASPLRLVYNNNQYFPANQYLPYLQNPSLASQIAAQYAYQPSAVPHYLQTPTQIQYVSPPSYQQVPTAQFKALVSKTPLAPTTSNAQSSTPSQAPATSQVLLPHNMAAAYQQQPVLMLLYPQQQPLVYPGHQMLLVNPQSPLLQNYYGQQHRFNLPYTSPATASQLAYLTVPNAQQQVQQQAVLSQESAEVQKQPINVQDTSASQTFGLRTKA